MQSSPTGVPVHEALTARHPHIGRGQAVALTMEGLVLVNGFPARHPDQCVRPGDAVTLQDFSAPDALID
ncbi:hypothetical protein [Nocardia sp. NPDC003963]